MIHASMIDFLKTFKYGEIELGFKPTEIGRILGGARSFSMKNYKLPNQTTPNKKKEKSTRLIYYRIGDANLSFDSKYNALRMLHICPNADLEGSVIKHGDDWVYEQNLADMSLSKVLKELDLEFNCDYSMDGIIYTINRKAPLDIQYIVLEFNKKIKNAEFSFYLSVIRLYDGDINNDDFYTEGPANYVQ